MKEQSRSRSNILLFFLLIFSGFLSNVYTQAGNDLNLKLHQKVYLSEKTAENSFNSPYLSFPNLEKTAYYKDEKSLKAIEEAELNEDHRSLDSMLTGYISNFGIENFNKDVDLIWKAGQVKEIVGDTSASLMYYELGIKNQKPYEERVKIHLDSLKERTSSEWVELQFYYKLLEARRKLDPLIPPKGVMLNMGTKINSSSPDYAPFMHPSDSVVLFTSRRNEDIVIDVFENKQNEDLFFSQKDFVNGIWSYAEKFSGKINSEYNEGSACLSPDGRTLIFTRCDAPDGFGSCDLYIAEYKGGAWRGIRNLGAAVNSNAWDSHPNLTPDGNILYFTSNRTGGFGMSDLYISVKDSNGVWGKAKNLGPTVNTIEDEVTPFYHKVNNTLYFSSTGHLKNMGGYDIFKSRWFNTHWEAPKNVGPLVNSPGNEYYFSIDGKGTRLFYAKAKESEKGPQVEQNFDLYSFPMPMEARPDAIVTLKGYLIDSASGHPVTGVVLVIDKTTGIEVAPKIINRFGYFEFDLINNKKYDIYIQGDNYLTIKDDVVLKGDTTFQIFANSFEAGKPLVFESLQFEENSYNLDDRIEPKLDYITAFLKRYPMFNLVVKGHTDSDGEARYNLELSRKRSYMIRRYILKRGNLDDGRVLALGYGETKPLVANDTKEHKRKNRRVEFEILLDPGFAGDRIFPTAKEFMYEEGEEIFDPEFSKEEELEEDFEFDWEEDEMEDWDWEDVETDDELLKEFDDFEGWDTWDEEDPGEDLDTELDPGDE